MNFLTKVIVGFFVFGIIFFVVLLAAMGIAGIQAKEDSMKAVYSYDLSISTSKPIYNATLLIPLPCGYDNESGEYNTIFNLSETSFHNFEKDNVSLQIEALNGYMVLNITSNTIFPLYKNHIEPIPIYPGQNESELPPTPTTIYSHSYSPETPESVSMELHAYIIKKDGEIDTKHPFEKEQLMRPFSVLNMTGKDDGFFSKDSFKGKISDDYSESCIEVPVYLSYESDPDNTLGISCSLRGANEWWVFGWQWNEYEQRIGNSFTGSRKGTYVLEGFLVAGKGVY